MSPLLEVEHLNLTLKKGSHFVNLLHDISFSIYPGEIVGLLGESGSGKSLTAAAILGLLPNQFAHQGRIVFEGHELINNTSPNLPKLLGTRLSLVLQDPALALNPLLPIGKQLIEGLCYHKKVSKFEATEKGIQWLERVGIRDARSRMNQYPHEISGGMKQRILIAMALICQPSLLIADEPTTALDVSVQAQILDLLQILQKQEKMSILLITHDLGVVAQVCQRAIIMYAGQIIETGAVNDILTNPQHPYTQGLLKSRQSLENSLDKPLAMLAGHPPSLNSKIQGCAFAPRCPKAMQICLKEHPPIVKTHQGHTCCWFPESQRKKS